MAQCEQYIRLGSQSGHVLLRVGCLVVITTRLDHGDPDKLLQQRFADLVCRAGAWSVQCLTQRRRMGNVAACYAYAYRRRCVSRSVISCGSHSIFTVVVDEERRSLWVATIADYGMPY